MSRKTAVCVLFVFLLTVAGALCPAHAWAWGGDGSAPAEPAGPTAVTLATGPDADPDGLVTPWPELADGHFVGLLRLLFGSLVL